MTPHIMVVEDDKDLSLYLETLLKERKYIVKVSQDGANALKHLEEFNPDLVLLDLMLPDMDGQYLCEEIKKKLPETQVIMLSAKDSLEDKVQGFRKGADDYLTKPFEPEELFARIKARLRKTPGTQILRVGDLTLDPKKIEVTRESTKIDLTPQEFKLLEYLMANRGVVLSRDMILNHIWTYSSDVDTRVVDVYVGYLRKKIDNNFKKKYIRSVRGFGYTVKE